jgi:hypothetical protein
MTGKAGTSEVQQRYTKGVSAVHAKYLAAAPRRPPLNAPASPVSCPLSTAGTLAAGVSARIVAEPGDTCQEPFAFEHPQRLAAGLPRMSMLLAVKGH